MDDEEEEEDELAAEIAAAAEINFAEMQAEAQRGIGEEAGNTDVEADDEEVVLAAEAAEMRDGELSEDV